MKKILLLAATILAIGTAALAGCNDGKLNDTNNAVPELHQYVQDAQADDCNDGDCKQQESEDGLPDGDKIPDVRNRSHIKRRRGHRHGPDGKYRPEPRRMPRMPE